MRKQPTSTLTKTTYLEDDSDVDEVDYLSTLQRSERNEASTRDSAPALAIREQLVDYSSASEEEKEERQKRPPSPLSPPRRKQRAIEAEEEQLARESLNVSSSQSVRRHLGVFL